MVSKTIAAGKRTRFLEWLILFKPPSGGSAVAQYQYSIGAVLDALEQRLYCRVSVNLIQLGRGMNVAPFETARPKSKLLVGYLPQPFAEPLTITRADRQAVQAQLAQRAGFTMDRMPAPTVRSNA